MEPLVQEQLAGQRLLITLFFPLSQQTLATDSFAQPWGCQTEQWLLWVKQL